MTKKKITTAKKTPKKAKSSVAKAAANKATKAKPATPKNNATKPRRLQNQWLQKEQPEQNSIFEFEVDSQKTRGGSEKAR